MRHLNELFGQHQFEFWIIAIFIGILNPYARSVVGFIRALPRGFRAAVRYQREAKIERLERYAADKTRIFRNILANVCVFVLVTTGWTLHITDRLFLEAGSTGHALSDLIAHLFRELGAVYLLLSAAASAALYCAAITLLALWTFRDPERQIKRIRERLATDANNQSDSRQVPHE